MIHEGPRRDPRRTAKKREEAKKAIHEGGKNDPERRRRATKGLEESREGSREQTATEGREGLIGGKRLNTHKRRDPVLPNPVFGGPGNSRPLSRPLNIHEGARRTTKGYQGVPPYPRTNAYTDIHAIPLPVSSTPLASQICRGPSHCYDIGRAIFCSVLTLESTPSPSAQR